MEPKQHKFTFDIDQGTKEKIVVVTQDYAAHKFEISIVEDDYKPFNLANTVVRLMVIKPNGESKQQDCATVDEAKGKVSLLLALDVIDTPGTCKAEIQFWDTALANKRFTSSATFSFYVRKSMQDDTTAEGTDEFSMLQDALEEARNYGEVKDEVVAARGTSASLNDRLTTDENNLTSHKADFMPHGINNAGFHNSIYRGKYLGNTVTSEQYNAISSGTFEDLYIGDCWTINGINWRIAAFNYWRNTGDALVPGNHITLVPDTALYSHVMNSTNITTGGYVGSEMYTVGLEQAKTTIRGIFGSHLVKHRQYLCNAVTDGKASGGAYFDSEVDLMNEVMVYGSVVNGDSTYGLYNIGMGKSQLPLFALNPQSINTRYSYWLRDVASAAHFAYVTGNGLANHTNASDASGVRPAFSIS